MSPTQYAVAHDLGYAVAYQKILDLNERDPFWRDAGTFDRDDVRDMAHPDAFSDALDALPDCEALDVSSAVDAGIADAFDSAS